MARRVPISETQKAIQAIEEDGGVILTGFSSVADVEKVSADAASFIDEILRKVKKKPLFTFLYLRILWLTDSIKASIHIAPPRNNTLHPSLWPQHHRTRKMASAARLAADRQPLPVHRYHTIQ